MVTLIIPSWYPSPDASLPGIFFREQAEIYAKHHPDDTVVISHWGPNDRRLLVEAGNPLGGLKKLLSRLPKPEDRELATNCVEWFQPAFTWTRKFRKGNIAKLIEVSQVNFERCIRKYGKPSIIHAHVSYPAGFVAMELSKIYQVPYVITEHMGPFPFASFPSRKGLNKYLEMPLERADQVLAVSDSLKRTLESYHIESKVFNNYIDDDFFSPGKPNEDGEFTFLHVGRLDPIKGQDVLLNAVSTLKNEQFKLVIIGDGWLRSKLEALAKELEIEHLVEFKGQKGREEVRDAMRDCDAFVLTSLYENFPVSILEAMACGKRVIATRCGGPEEMIAADTGILVEPGTEEELAAAMKRIMDTDHSEPADIRKQFENKYGSMASVSELNAIYQQVINSR